MPLPTFGAHERRGWRLAARTPGFDVIDPDRLAWEPAVTGYDTIMIG
ncbi:hypothetical protein [Nocardia sp. NPDC058497]